MKKTLIIVVFVISSWFCIAKEYSEKIYLWEDIPKMETNIRDSVLYYCTTKNLDSEKEKKPAVIICPGGSYHHLGIPHEGFATAKWFNSIGIKAFVLRYRVAYNCHHYPAQLEDFQRAITFIRENAEKYGIDKNKIGAIGFSAGGHLVTMAGAFSNRNEIQKLGLNSKESLRPDFIMPIYPVVTMQDDICHKWSRKSLLGHQWKKPKAIKGWSIFNFFGHAYSQELKNEFSMELNIPQNMPPTFLLACEDDPVVIYENSIRLKKALEDKKIPHLFVSYPEGGHGFGMKKDSDIMKKTSWNDKRLLPWLKEIGIL
ncbi:MAG: alpha/beta hydrolase [Treponema sp.]|nr:alpha/beta hydrolase [Treponema sp.]